MPHRPGAPIGNQMSGHPMNNTQVSMMPNGMPHGNFNGPANMNGQPPSSSYPRSNMPHQSSMNQGNQGQYGVHQGPQGTHPPQVSQTTSSQMSNISSQSSMPSQPEISNGHQPNLTSQSIPISQNNSNMSSQASGMLPQSN